MLALFQAGPKPLQSDLYSGLQSNPKIFKKNECIQLI
jgi:hypothetical protein